VTAAVGVEEGEDVHADDWVKTQPLCDQNMSAEGSDVMVDGGER
jgi:hypothetical protein